MTSALPPLLVRALPLSWRKPDLIINLSLNVKFQQTNTLSLSLSLSLFRLEKYLKIFHKSKIF
jgi:hypothetical protein